LDACLPGGTSFDGTVSFNCGGPATITVTSTKDISADTTIDGAGVIALGGGGTISTCDLIPAGLAGKCTGGGGINAGPGTCSPNPCLPGATTSTTGTTTSTTGATTTTTLGQIQCCFTNPAGVFSVDPGVTFTVQNLTMADGPTSAIMNAGTLIVTNGTFSDNSPAGAITNGGGATLIVNNSTFSGNSAGVNFGGAIVNSGTLTVTNSTFSGNTTDDTGGAIWNNGTLTVTGSTFSGNSGDGGAIFNTDGATGTVIDCTFSGNSASAVAGNDHGGAITNKGTLAVTNSTFSGNSAPDRSGAIDNKDGMLTVTNSTFSGNSIGVNGEGGGAISNSGTLNVTNSTFSGNIAHGVFGGGAISDSGVMVTVTNSTFTDNTSPTGGAIFTIGAVSVVNSILANSAQGGNCSATVTFQGSTYNGTISDGGHNIDDGTTCGFTGSGCSSTGGTSFCNTSPLLDPSGLVSNGGPTQTIALELGSPAINAGDKTVCAAPPVNDLDQRGFLRPGVGATNCSIGAYEFNGTTTTQVQPGLSKALQKCESGTGSALSKVVGASAQCVAKCITKARKSGGPFSGCFGPDYTDPTTHACIMGSLKGTEAKGGATIAKVCSQTTPLLRDAAISSCPMCYVGNGAIGAAGCADGSGANPWVQRAAEAVNFLVSPPFGAYCVESGGAVPSKSDAKCEDSLTKVLVKFVGAKTKCYQKCNANIASSKIPSGSCDPLSPTDPTTIACVVGPKGAEAKASAAIDKACFIAPATQPSCITYQPGAEWVSEIESVLDPQIGEINCGSSSGAFLD
jgi:hypothetical protein